MYQILTENKNSEGIKQLLESEGMDYTLFPAQGSYHQHPEGSLVIELEQPEDKVLEAAKKIAALNNQESVLVEQIPTRFTLVQNEISVHG